MRIFALTLTCFLVVGLTEAKTTEPCKNETIPSKINSSMMIFEFPVYDEYLEQVAQNALEAGKKINESTVLSESTFNEVRATKIKIIEQNYRGEFTVMSVKEVRQMEAYDGFIFRESVIDELVTEDATSFEEYTAFTLSEIATFSEYKLVNPSLDQDANCLLHGNDYEFSELIGIVQ